MKTVLSIFSLSLFLTQCQLNDNRETIILELESFAQTINPDSIFNINDLPLNATESAATSKTDDSLSTIQYEYTVGFEQNKYQLFSLDFDHDGDLDKVYSHKFLAGDSLFVFQNMDGHYTPSLKTTNFSEGGIYMIDSIGVKEDSSLGDFVVYTHFNGSGGLERNIYFSQQRSQFWEISYTEYEFISCEDQDQCFNKYCLIPQNLPLTIHTNWGNLIHPDAMTIWKETPLQQ